MGRYRYTAYISDHLPRYLVVWSVHWALIDCQRLEPGADLFGAMAATIKRLSVEGWQAEAEPEYGFVFIRNRNDRRLLMLTSRDPYSTSSQSFSPF